MNMDLGPAELIIILVIVMLLFGAKRLPDLAHGIGRASREFRRGLHDTTDDSSPADEKAG